MERGLQSGSAKSGGGERVSDRCVSDCFRAAAGFGAICGGGRCRNSVGKCRSLREVMVAWAGSCEVALVCGSIEVKRGIVGSFVDFCLFINGI